LYVIIAMLGSLDFLLFARIVRCRGNFFCWELCIIIYIL
jgi:hypothetical protein